MKLNKRMDSTMLQSARALDLDHSTFVALVFQTPRNAVHWNIDARMYIVLPIVTICSIGTGAIAFIAVVGTIRYF